MTARDRLAFALDVPDREQALPLLDRIAPEVGLIKVGLELFVREGPAAVRAVRERGARVFLDLKLHDIPNTVQRAAASAASLDVDLLTVHASGGASMVRAASAGAGSPGCKVIAVTALTSLDASDLTSLGLHETPGEWVERLAALALSSGAAGLVCSPREVGELRRRHPGAFLVTPGIRLPGGDVGDQARIATPEDAIRAGADLLVVGRPIAAAADPVAAAREVVRRIEDALAQRRT